MGPLGALKGPIGPFLAVLGRGRYPRGSADPVGSIRCKYRPKRSHDDPFRTIFDVLGPLQGLGFPSPVAKGRRCLAGACFSAQESTCLPKGPPRGWDFQALLLRGGVASQERFFPTKKALFCQKGPLGPPGGWDFQALLLRGGVASQGRFFSGQKSTFLKRSRPQGQKP